MAAIFFMDKNPVLDTILFQRHPLENQFPIGSYVKVSMDLAPLTAKIAKDWNIRQAAAQGIAQYLLKTPVEVIGISDLQDTDGQTKPFVSIMDSEGYLYIMSPDSLTPVKNG